MGKLRPPFENEELGSRAADALHEINQFGHDPRVILEEFLSSMEINFKTYLNDIFEFDFKWINMELWQLLPIVEELAVVRFSTETSSEKAFWINHIQDISQYFIDLQTLLSKEALKELSAPEVRAYAQLTLGSMTIASKLCEKPLDHPSYGPTSSEFRVLSGAYPLIENMRPDTTAGEMAAIIDSCRQSTDLHSNTPPDSSTEGLYRFAEIISRDPLYYAEQQSTRPHIHYEIADGITQGTLLDGRFHASQTRDFIKYIRESRNFLIAKAQLGDVKDSFILAVAAIKYAYKALRDIQEMEYRPWRKIEQNFIDEYASAARYCKQRLDYALAQANAGRNLSSKRDDPSKFFYTRFTEELKRQLSPSQLIENPSRIPYRHTIEREIVAEFEAKKLFIPKAEARKRWIRNNTKEFLWAAWDSSHSEAPTTKFIPRHITQIAIENNYNKDSLNSKN